jgi:hypothetical protein
MMHDTSAQPLLKPHIFKWFSRNQARTPRILRYKYYFCGATIEALQRFVPGPPVGNLTPFTDYEVVVIGVHLVNRIVETGKFPLLIKPFTGGNRSGTMSATDIFGIIPIEYRSEDVGCGCSQCSRFRRLRIASFLFVFEKRRDNRVLFSRAIGEFQLVAEIQHLPDVTNSKRVSIVSEPTLIVEDQLEVLLHKSRPTPDPLRMCEATGYREVGSLQSLFEGFR